MSKKIWIDAISRLVETGGAVINHSEKIKLTGFTEEQLALVADMIHGACARPSADAVFETLRDAYRDLAKRRG